LWRPRQIPYKETIRKTVFAHELLERHAQMHLALAPQHHLAHVLAVSERDRGVLLDDLGDGSGELNLVLLLLGGYCQPEHRLGDICLLDLDRFSLLLDEGVAGLDAVEAAEGYRVAGMSLAALDGLLAHDAENA
jgi:hypothetical protein